MTLRTFIHHLWVALLLPLLLLSACSSHDDDEGTDELVNLTVRATSQATSAASGTTIDKDNRIKDLTILVFAQNGKVIGYAFQDGINNNQTSVAVRVSKSNSCKVYAIANVKAVTGKSGIFAGKTTLTDVEGVLYSMTNADAPNSATELLMFGSDTGDINTNTSFSIKLKRLASKLTFNIQVNEDKNAHLPIVVEGYQLCNVPLTAYYAQDNKNVTQYGNCQEQNTAINSWSVVSNSATYTSYVYANPSTSQTDATYLLIKAHSQASSTDATHKVWQSVFKVYLPGYHLLSNTCYHVNITIQGSSTSKNGGVITSYEMYSFFNGNISKWDDETISKDL